MKELLLKMRLVNNRLYRARTELGLSQKALAEVAKVPYQAVNSLECLRTKAYRKDGTPTGAAHLVAKALGLGTDELFPPLTQMVEQRRALLELNGRDARALASGHWIGGGSWSAEAALGPEEALMLKERDGIVMKALNALPPKKRWMVTRRLGAYEKEEASKLGDVSEVVGLSRSYGSVVIAKMLSRMYGMLAPHLWEYGYCERPEFWHDGTKWQRSADWKPSLPDEYEGSVEKREGEKNEPTPPKPIKLALKSGKWTPGFDRALAYAFGALYADGSYPDEMSKEIPPALDELARMDGDAETRFTWQDCLRRMEALTRRSFHKNWDKNGARRIRRGSIRWWKKRIESIEGAAVDSAAG